MKKEKEIQYELHVTVKDCEGATVRYKKVNAQLLEKDNILEAEAVLNNVTNIMNNGVWSKDAQTYYPPCVVRKIEVVGVKKALRGVTPPKDSLADKF